MASIQYRRSSTNGNTPLPAHLFVNNRRPVSNATSIDGSDTEDYRKSIPNGWPSRKRDVIMRTMVKEEEDVSDAESFDSLSSRAKFMSDLLTDSDSSSLSDRNSIYSYGPQTPGTPSPEYMDDGFAVEIMGEKSPRSSRSVSMEASPTFAAKVKEMTTVGPRGPHLFRSFSTNHSTSKVAKITIPQSPRVERVGSRSPPATASRASFSPSLKSRASHGRGPQTADFVKMTPTMDSEPIVLMRPRSEQHSIVSEYDFEEVRSWAPNQVCAWMAALGFENEMVEKFATNDITGAILIDLKWDDLKELDIKSFGKRIELWTEIHHLRARSLPSPDREEFVRTSTRISRSNSTVSHASRMRSGSLTSPTLHMMSVREDDVAKGFETRALPEIPHSASRAGSPNVQQEINDEADEEDSEVEVRRTTRPKLRKKRRTNVRMPHRQVAVESIIITTDDEAPGGYVAKLEAKSFDTGRLTRRNSRRDSVAPSESVSVRAIRRHKSRKEKPAPLEPMPMPKRNPTQKRQKNNSNVKQLGPFRPQSEFGHGTIIIATTPSIVDFNDQSRRASFQNSSPGGPDSNYEPSLLASSDALGPIQRSDLRLKESALREVARVDPLENVKQFLTHQHLQHLEEHRVSPPPVPNKTNQERIRANAMQMPPRSQSAAAMRISPFGSATIGPSAVSAPLVQPLRSQTPSVPLGQPLRSQTPSCGLRIQGMEQVIPPYNFVAAASSRGISPGMMRTTTPFSEADVPCPTSTTPFNFRDQSQSVPPDMMHYRRFPTPTIESLTAPIMPRSAGFRVENASLRSVDENAEWEEVKDEVKMAPSPNLRTHSGWMKKRRTNWFRHEWPDHHFVLQGTRLGYANDVATTEVGAIDMDEYQVACSNSGSTKLSAAFKAGRIFGKKKEDGITGSYFFQLVPAENKGGKRGLGKVHCFSVNTREERIDWMRELMLAKAIKQKGQGFEVEVNGERV